MVSETSVVFNEETRLIAREGYLHRIGILLRSYFLDLNSFNLVTGDIEWSEMMHNR
jgi:hypothetical protein